MLVFLFVAGTLSFLWGIFIIGSMIREGLGDVIPPFVKLITWFGLIIAISGIVAIHWSPS